MVVSKAYDDALIWMSGDYKTENIRFHSAVVRESLSGADAISVEFRSSDKMLNLRDFLGQRMAIHLETKTGAERIFSGHCISIESLGVKGGHNQCVAEIRPWFWLLTRTRNSRIFQDMTVIEIIEKVLSDHNLSDYDVRTNGEYAKRVYCVQYRESDFDFLCRMMELEGIYFYFENDLGATVEKMVICDDQGGHQGVPESEIIQFEHRETDSIEFEDHITEFSPELSVVSGRVTLDDFDPLNPTADLTVASIMNKGDHSFNNLELYDHPGKYVIDQKSATDHTSRGDTLAQVMMEGEAVKFMRWRGICGIRTMGAGRIFRMKEFPVKQANIKYLVTDAIHYLQALDLLSDEDADMSVFDQNLDIAPEFARVRYVCQFGSIPAAFPYRAPQVTPRPEIAGLQTATVVGPSGEEIYTDEYGRIKVQFHWDREGEMSENSSCFVRVATPWSGTGWGFVAIPRIGQEVVVQFEEGDPDRPICTGMLYNKETPQPYGLPDSKAQSGMKTDSTKSDDAEAYNELMFDDVAGEELLRMQAQKHHETLVKNKSSTTVGFDEMDYGNHDGEYSLSTVVKQNISELITDGDKFLEIKTGSETIDIKTDKTQTIEGKYTQTVKGNHATTIEMGNMTTDISAGKATTEAMQSIEFKVGNSSIKIDPMGVTIKGMTVKIEASMLAQVKGLMTKVEADSMLTAKAPMSTVKGEALLTLKGGLTMIN